MVNLQVDISVTVFRLAERNLIMELRFTQLPVVRLHDLLQEEVSGLLNQLFLLRTNLLLFLLLVLNYLMVLFVRLFFLFLDWFEER